LSPHKKALAFLGLTTFSSALLTTTENSTHYSIENDHLAIGVAKSNGHVVGIRLDGQDLLGPLNGNSGKGPYLDCSCVPSGFWTPGSSPQLVNGTDATGTAYVGIIMSDTYEQTNQTLSQYLFLRESESNILQRNNPVPSVSRRAADIVPT
jgi:rhamnogalacturonan endolyase